MKNFFKKLSFVLASAMVITSLYAPANTSAAAKDGIILKGKAVTKKGIFVGGEKVNFDYKIGKHNNKGANGKWSVSDTSVITVDKHGKVTAVGTGDATLYLKVKKNAKKGIKKNLTFKVKINAMARADKLTIPASDKAITLKVGEVKDIMPVLTDKVEGVKNTYTLFARTDNPTDVAVVVKDNAKVVVTANNPTATSATITVFAAQKSNEDDAFNNKYKQQDTFMVDVKANFSAKQTAANKIVVMGENLATDAAAYVVSSVKNKDVKLAIKSVELNKDKTEAVLLGDTIQFPEGDYVVTLKENKADITIEKAMSARFEITPADKAVAVLSGNKYTTAYVYYKVFDQFDNDITGTSLVNVQINGSHNPAAASNDRTKIVFTETNGFQIGLSKVTLNLYDLSNTKKSVSLSAVLDVTNEARVYEGTYLGLFDKDTNKMVESIDDMTDFTKKNIYAVFNFKDQYGNDVAASPNLKNEIFVAATGLTGVVVNPVAEALENKETKKEYVGFKLGKQSGVTELRQGEVELRATIFANASKSFTGKFQVTATPKVHDISVYVGSKGFYAGQKNELGFSALDQNGKAVTDISVLRKIKWSDSNLEFVEEKGKAVLKYDATGVSVTGTSETASQPVFFIATTETNAIKQFTLNISSKKIPTELIGLKKEVYPVLSGQPLVIPYGDLKFRDQYGRDMTADEVKATGESDYAVVATFEGTNKIVTGDAQGTVVANPTNVQTGAANTSATLTLSTAGLTNAVSVLNVKGGLADNKGDVEVVLTFSKGVKEYNKIKFKVKNVTVPELTKFEIVKPYVQKADGTYTPKVVGYYGDTKLTLGNTDVLNHADGQDLSTALNVPEEATLTNAKKDSLKVEYKLIVKDNKGTILNGEYTYMKAAAKKVVSEVKFDADKLVKDNNGTAFTWAANISTAFEVKDQFGDASNTAPYLTFTFNSEDTKGDTPKVAVKKNGLSDAEVTVNTVGSYTGKLRLTFPESSYVYEGEITFERVNP